MDRAADPGSTVFDIPAEVWDRHLLGFLDTRALSRLERTSARLRDIIAGHRETCGYGRRLVWICLRQICVRHLASNLHNLDAAVVAANLRGYLPELCRDILELGGGDPVPGHDVAELVISWGPQELASFLVIVASSQAVSRWKGASAAILWGLRALGCHALHDTLTARDPRAELVERVRAVNIPLFVPGGSAYGHFRVLRHANIYLQSPTVAAVMTAVGVDRAAEPVLRALGIRTIIEPLETLQIRLEESSGPFPSGGPNLSGIYCASAVEAMLTDVAPALAFR